MNAAAAPAGLSALDTCPRCRGSFHCGAADSAPCACSTLTLSAPLLARLRRDFGSCLCLACLAALAATEIPAAATPAD